MARRYVMTARRKAALRKAQLASARKRRRPSRKVKAAVAVGVATGVVLAGKRTSSHVKLFKEAKAFQMSGFDPESGYGPGRAKYTYKEHLSYRRMNYKSHRKYYRNKVTQIITGRQSKHPLANGLLAMQMKSGQYKHKTKIQRLVGATKNHRKAMIRYRSDPTL